MPIERVLFQHCEFVMVEFFVTHHKSTRLPIDLNQKCHLAVLRRTNLEIEMHAEIRKILAWVYA